MRASFLLFAAWSLLLAATLSSCDSAPGADALDQRPPVLSAFSYTPQSIVLEQIPRDLDNDVEEVAFVLQSPLPGADPVATGLLGPQGQGAYGTQVNVEIPTATVGAYTLLVYASDRSGLISNQVRGSVTFFATGSAPVIESVEAPATVTIPAAGETERFSVVATVTDPDGLGNLLRVFVTNPGGTEFTMCDDGGQVACGGFVSSGDETADDGRYTVTFEIDDTTPNATFEFRVQAVDRAGLSSNVVTVAITFEP